MPPRPVRRSPQPGEPRIFCRRAGRLDGGRRAVRTRSRPGARPRLLYPHRLRVVTTPSAPRARPGGRALRRLIAELGGPPDRRHRLGGRHRAAGHAGKRSSRGAAAGGIAPLGAAAEARALGIARALRRHGIAVEHISRQHEKAHATRQQAQCPCRDHSRRRRAGARVVQLKDLDSGGSARSGDRRARGRAEGLR